MHFPDESQLGVKQSIQAFNYIAWNSKKIASTVKQMQELKRETNSTIQANFQLDAQSVEQFLEDIKGLKIKVTSLRGMENNEVSERERLLYERAKEDRSKRLLQGIMHHDTPKSKLSFDVSQ